jgi:hypothetical protein
MTYFSNYLENALINATVRNTTFTSPATVYLGLFTSDPTDAGTGTEITGGSYARQSIIFASPSNGVTSNSAQITFPTATADWGTVGWIGIYDSLTSGNLLYHSPLTTSKTIANGDVFLVGTGNLTLTLS